MKCCICGKEFEGYGNNPQGVIQEFLPNKCVKLTEFSEEARCCDDCNRDIVITHRVFVSISGWKVV